MLFKIARDWSYFHYAEIIKLIFSPFFMILSTLKIQNQSHFPKLYLHSNSTLLQSGSIAFMNKACQNKSTALPLSLGAGESPNSDKIHGMIWKMFYLPTQTPSIHLSLFIKKN